MTKELEWELEYALNKAPDVQLRVESVNYLTLLIENPYFLRVC